MPARLRDAYPTPMRPAMSLLWLAGALLALVTTPLALAHAAGPAVAAYPLVAAVLIALAIATWLRAWWALGVSFAASGGQVFGVIGSLVELIAGIDRGKSAGLRAMGVDPTLAVAINLAYAAVSCCLFVAAVTRLRLSAPSRRVRGMDGVAEMKSLDTLTSDTIREFVVARREEASRPSPKART